MEGFTRAAILRIVLFGLAYYVLVRLTPESSTRQAGAVLIGMALIVWAFLLVPRREWWLVACTAVAARALATMRGGTPAVADGLALALTIPLGAVAAIALAQITRRRAVPVDRPVNTGSTTELKHTTDDDCLRLAALLEASTRELSLLHAITRIVQHGDFAQTGDRLREVGDAIRHMWPDPGVLGVRTRLGTSVIASAELEDRQWSHRAVFSVTDGRIGAIEMAYETHPATSRSALLDAIAEMLRKGIDRHLVTFALSQSEERYRSVVEHQSDMVCRFLVDTTLTFVNEAYCRYFEKDRDRLIGLRFIDLIPEADREGTRRQIEALLRGERPPAYEHSVLRPDGTIGRQQWVNHAIVSPEGRIEEFQGIGRDITDRWRVEEELRGKEASLNGAYQRIRMLAQRLILAQEAERTEIARDLHDDISQQLAAVTIELSLIESRVKEQPAVATRVARVRQLAGELADKVRATSHALHPGVLKHAGLASALASHCDALTAQHEIQVTFEPRGRFDDVADDLALCVYRVAQQALRNVVMHAEATHATVTLARHDGRIELVVADNGRGFDPAKAHVRGIGLMSMEERVSLVHGTLMVDSTQGGGARLRIDVPVQGRRLE
ncbi:MAG TPA: PAS domain S-box protein [Vicinamibacterales bacterium]|nr:PAS domain S-box protein [Vicinamibacterales bacterium]